MTEIALAAVYRIIKNAGCERAGEEAAVELRAVLEEWGTSVAKQAMEFALQAGRKTLKASDIKLVVKTTVNPP